MEFKVTILGTGAAIPTLRRGTTSQMVSCHQRKILIDCGEGTQLQMRKFQVKFQDIQLILISHLHGDHIFGLPGLISTMQLLGRSKPLLIVGPKGIKSFLNTQFDAVGLSKIFPIHFTEILESTKKRLVFEDKCLSISAFSLKHRIPTFGYRIDEKPGKRHLNPLKFDKTGVSVAYIHKLKEGKDIVDNQGVLVRSKDVTSPPDATKSYAFCSDTAFHPPIIEHIRGVDLLYHEATFLEKERERAHSTLHSTAKEAAQIAYRSEVGKLILGHLSARYKKNNPHLEEAQEVFKATSVAKDGEEFRLT